MTEDEAKTTWCPEIEITENEGYFTSNRGEWVLDVNSINTCCIASECQWWGWDSVSTMDKSMLVPSDKHGRCGAVK